MGLRSTEKIISSDLISSVISVIFLVRHAPNPALLPSAEKSVENSITARLLAVSRKFRKINQQKISNVMLSARSHYSATSY